MNPKAFIFDLDGVITDTTRYHYNAWKALAAQKGFAFNEVCNERLKGVGRNRCMEIILEENGIRARFSDSEIQEMADEKNEIYLNMIEQIQPADILPGICTFLEEAHQAGIRLALASASRNAERVLARLGLSARFDYRAEAKDIARGKPAPDIFLNCCAGLGVKPCEAVGFEDAQAGVKAIRAAGMISVGIGIKEPGIMPDIRLKDTCELQLPRLLALLEPYREKTND